MAQTVAEREKWTAEKRSDDPFLLATHNDFVTFAPDGPLRQIQIPQIRLLKERAQFGPLRTFTMANSNHPNHTVLARDLHTYLRWRNADLDRGSIGAGRASG